MVTLLSSLLFNFEFLDIPYLYIAKCFLNIEIYHSHKVTLRICRMFF